MRFYTPILTEPEKDLILEALEAFDKTRPDHKAAELRRKIDRVQPESRAAWDDNDLPKHL